MWARSATRFGTAKRNIARLANPRVHVTPPPEEVVFDRDVPVVVRDGVSLRANVFRPASNGQYPVLVSAQPYGKDSLPRRRLGGYAVPLQYRLAGQDEPMTISAWASLEAPDPGFWVPRGYVVVNVDLRGWGHSDGDPEPFSPTEGDDLYDVIEWAAGQPWSTGRVGMSGVSYLAISQWTAAATRPPHLAAISPWEGFTDGYSDFFYPGGIREDGFAVTWSLWQRLLKHSAPSFRAAQKQHSLRDEFWAARSPQVDKIDVPALVCGSFSDHSLHSRGSFEGFTRISSQHKWLYTHRGPKWATYYGAEALTVQAQFFDHFLRGQDTGILDRPPVRVEVRDTLSDVVAVRGADTWPPRESRPRTLHLDAAHAALGEHAASGDASVEPGRTGARFTWRVERDTDVVGPMRLRVQVSVEGEDLCLFAAVRKMRAGREVVFEGSYGFTEDVVTKGWLRATHRGVDDARSTAWEAYHPHEVRQPVRAGEVIELDLTLLPSATRFAAGDELVLELRDHFFFPANPTTGQFPAIYARAPRARWAVRTGPTHASTLTIPVWTPSDVPAPDDRSTQPR